jgi:hypothetical protein
MPVSSGAPAMAIDATYGHLAHDADDQDRILLDAYDALEANVGHTVGTKPRRDAGPGTRNPAGAGLSEDGRGGFRTCDLSRVKRDEGELDQPPEQGRLF